MRRKRKGNTLKNSLKHRFFSLNLAFHTLIKPPSRALFYMVAIVPTAIQVQMPYLASSQPQAMLATREISLSERYKVPSVNEVFKDNILLNLAYLRGSVQNPTNINWDEVKKPFDFSFKLEPGQKFAFHDDVLPEYEGKIALTTNAHFNSREGFKSDGYLVGDGVCHLASIFYWAAKDAGLAALAPTNHDFMPIPQIPKEYGVAIYSMPGSAVSAVQNLYITNDKKNPVEFTISYKDDTLTVKIVEEKNI